MTKRAAWMIVATLVSVAGCSDKGVDEYKPGQVAANGAAAKPLGSSWADVGKMPDFFAGNWRSASDMVDGPMEVSYTDKAKEYMAKYKPKSDIQLANENCKTAGMPIVMRSSTPAKFMYEPGMISIYLEHASQTRFIFLNQESVSNNPTYLGNSTGHFEGDTLVVETVGFVDDIVFQYGARPGAKVMPGFVPEPGPEGAEEQSFLSDIIFGPHGPNMRMVERMRLSDPDTLEIKLTIYDDTVFTAPYEPEPRYWKRQIGIQGKPQEWVCTAAITYYDEKAGKHLDMNPEDALKLLEQQRKTASGL